MRGQSEKKSEVRNEVWRVVWLIVAGGKAGDLRQSLKHCDWVSDERDLVKAMSVEFLLALAK